MKTPFIQVTRKLEHGDALMLYTDGIEEAKRHFRDESYDVIPCADVPKDQPHENHSGGQDNEEFGYERITARPRGGRARRRPTASRSTHNPSRRRGPQLRLLDLRGQPGGEGPRPHLGREGVPACTATPRPPTRTRSSSTRRSTPSSTKHFDQYRLYCSRQAALRGSHENPGYLLYAGIKEDAQYDDLTILGDTEEMRRRR